MAESPLTRVLVLRATWFLHTCCERPVSSLTFLKASASVTCKIGSSQAFSYSAPSPDSSSILRTSPLVASTAYYNGHWSHPPQPLSSGNQQAITLSSSRALPRDELHRSIDTAFSDTYSQAVHHSCYCSITQTQNIQHDCQPIHKRKSVQNFIATQERLTVYWFPTAVPELNPVEFIWTQGSEYTVRALSHNRTELRANLMAGVATKTDLPFSKISSCLRRFWFATLHLTNAAVLF